MGTLSGTTTPPKPYESVERDHDYYVEPATTIDSKDDIFIKLEPLSPASCATTGNLIDNQIRLTERGKRPVKRRSDASSDFVFDSDFGDSDGSVDWEPTKNSTSVNAGKIKRPRTSKSSGRPESDSESVGSSFTTDKYRELRDKNNEASRRSRLNRKQRDLEMKKISEKLESENRKLRARADRMQKLVLDMREIILKTIKGAYKR